MIKAFFDTNVLIYAFEDAPKAPKAETLMQAGGVISVQILNEFTFACGRKKRLPISAISTMLQYVRQLLEVVPLTIELHDSGLLIAERYGFNIYDSLIVATALETNCTTLYTEDLQHGQVIEQTLTIVNPFA